MKAKTIYEQIRPFVSDQKWVIVQSIVCTFLMAALAQVNPLAVKYAVDFFQNKPDVAHGSLFGLGIAAFLAVILLSKEVVSSFLMYFQKIAGEKIKVSVATKLSNYSLDRLLSYGYSFFSRNDNSPGDLAMRVDKGIEGVTKTIKNVFVDLFPLLATAVVGVIVMFLANPLVGFVSIIIIPVYAYLSIKQAKMQGGVRLKIQDYKEKRNGKVIRVLGSIPIIKSFVAESVEIKLHQRGNEDLAKTEMHHHRTNFAFDGVKNFSEQIGLVGVVVVTVALVSSGAADVGAIALHIMLFANISAPIKHIHRIYDEYQEAITYAQGFFRDIGDNDQIEKSGSSKLVNFKGSIELRNLSFSYSPGLKRTIDDVSILIEKNKTTALVGASGAGKTTLLNLMLKFYNPSSGAILLDGVDLSELDNFSLREKIGVVLQNSHVFPGSIRDNVCYGLGEMDDAKIYDALRKAHMLDIVNNLPQNIDSLATALSGGQKQRLAIARVFLKNPPILFLDEPTASLDAISTEEVKKSLEEIKVGRTVVVISHDISQFIDADLIYVLKEGSVVQSGRHQDLVSINGTYNELISAAKRSNKIESW